MLQVILSDPYLSCLYRSSYEELDDICGSASPVVEIGAGSCFSWTTSPDWLRLDILHDPRLDLRADSLQLPFLSESVGAIVLRDTWHHIPDLPAFLSECTRVLKPAGKIVVSDPYWGFLARFVYRHLHQEDFDEHVENWRFAAESPWCSNQALAYIALRRDRAVLSQRWPHFSVVEHGPRVGPSFLLSGGVSRRTRVPGRVLRMLLKFELQAGKWLNPLRFFFVFELRKEPGT